MSMPIDNFIVQTNKGYYCAAGDFYIDSKQPVKDVLISHAHADHAVPYNTNVYCTNATKTFMQYRYNANAGSNFIIAEYGKSFDINGVEATFYPAGHILGSAQIVLQYQGVKYLYTGDFKLQSDATCEPFEFVQADVLITETTFANPDFKHPNPEDEIRKLNDVKGKNVMIGAYVLGKAQRITQLVSEYCGDKNLMIHPDIVNYHKMYEAAGMNIGKWNAYSRNVVKNSAANILIVPPPVFKRYGRNAGYLLAFATGWADLQARSDIFLTISDHADWDDIHLLINKVAPKQILTIHGDGSHLADFYSDKNIRISEMKKSN
jgi:putative mRNA 3-end processing factor